MPNQRLFLAFALLFVGFLLWQQWELDYRTPTAAQAVDLMYHLAGGTAVYRRSPLQRLFRDVHVATQHMMVGPATLELSGRLLLGLETDTSTL